jgi:hypothetical protein
MHLAATSLRAVDLVAIKSDDTGAVPVAITAPAANGAGWRADVATISHSRPGMSDSREDGRR